MNRLALALLTLSAALACDLPGTAENAEERFVERAASANMLRVRLAYAALSHGSNEAVQKLAAGVLADERGARAQLARAAFQSDIDVPGDLSRPHQREYIRLSGLRGDDFDRAYLAALIESHEQALPAFRAEAERSASAVGKWAAASLPALEKRLSEARELAAAPSPVRISAASTD